MCARLDDTFGPHATDCRGDFDFTLLFEESILCLLPLTLLLIVAPFRILYLFKKDRKVVPSPLLSLKLVCAIPEVGFQFLLQCTDHELCPGLSRCLRIITISSPGPMGKAIRDQEPSIGSRGHCYCCRLISLLPPILR